MSVQSKYQNVINLGEKLGLANASVSEENGVLHFKGTVDNEYEKNMLWNAIKAVGGDSPSDIMADIQVANDGYYAKHTVEAGESLSKIAKHYYEDMMMYPKIFDANRDILDDPDKIQVGQVLTIPKM